MTKSSEPPTINSTSNFSRQPHLCKGQVEILERLGRHKARHLVLELARPEVEHRRKPTLGPHPLVDILESPLCHFEVPVVLRRLIQVHVALDELGSERIPKVDAVAAVRVE